MAISTKVQKTVRLGEVFGTSFKTFGRHVVVLVVLSAIAHIPEYFHDMTVQIFPGGDLLTSIVDLMCVMIAYGAIIDGVIHELAGHPVSTAQSIVIAARRLSALAGLLVAVSLLNALAWEQLLPESTTDAAASESAAVLYALIVMSVSWLVMAMYFVMAPVCIAEQASIGAALSRWRFLTKGHRWQIFGTILLAGSLDVAIFGGWVSGWLTINEGQGVLVVLGAFNAVLAAVFYDRLHPIRQHSFEDDTRIAKVFD